MSLYDSGRLLSTPQDVRLSGDVIEFSYSMGFLEEAERVSIQGIVTGHEAEEAYKGALSIR